MPDSQPIDLSGLQPQDHETVTVGAAATSLTMAKAGNAYVAEVWCEGDQIRYWKDSLSSAPTSSLGILVGAGEKFYLIGPEITGFQAIRVAGNATLQVQYYLPRTGARRWKGEKF